MSCLHMQMPQHTTQALGCSHLLPNQQTQHRSRCASTGTLKKLVLLFYLSGKLTNPWACQHGGFWYHIWYPWLRRLLLWKESSVFLEINLTNTCMHQRRITLKHLSCCITTKESCLHNEAHVLNMHICCNLHPANQCTLYRYI